MKTAKAAAARVRNPKPRHSDQAQLDAIFQNAPLPMLLIDGERVVRRANPAAAKLVGDGPDAMLGKRGGEALHCANSINDLGGCGFAEACQTCLVRRTVMDTFHSRQAHSQLEATVLVAADAAIQEAHLLLSTIPVAVDAEPMVLACVENVTDRKRAEASIRHLASFPEANPNPILEVDRDGHVTYLNPAAQRMLDEAGLSDALALCPPDVSQLAASISVGAITQCDREVTLGTRVLAEHVHFLPQFQTMRIYISDVTDRKRAEDELRHAASVDRLTGLPNRALLLDRIQQAIVRRKRSRGHAYAVLFLDFDRFKTINDSLGHAAGDLLLQEIARRLRSMVRASDSVGVGGGDQTAARLGGDEFVVLLDGLARPADAALVADRLLETFAVPVQLGPHEVYSSVSIGIVTSEVPADTAEEVLRDADTAMYEAKLRGKGQYVAFDVSMRQRVQDRLHLENDLRRALEAGQLFLVYQPIVSLQTGEVDSVEALLRWRHPERGLIPPAEFIPVAEDTGMILSIGHWVLREACRQFAGWQKLMGDAAPRSISVNLSRNQLAMPELPALVSQALAESGISPHCLHLEVTEGTVMKDAAAAVRVLRALKEQGVKLAIDDFGTGYSSLACLHQFPIDVLKIDRSFVANIDRGRGFTALVDAVATLARNLNISVVAEGIETVEQLLVLQSLACEFGQGFLFSRPVPPEDVPRFRVQPDMLLPGENEVLPRVRSA